MIGPADLLSASKLAPSVANSAGSAAGASQSSSVGASHQADNVAAWFDEPAAIRLAAVTTGTSVETHAGLVLAHLLGGDPDQRP